MTTPTRYTYADVIAQCGPDSADRIVMFEHGAYSVTRLRLRHNAILCPCCGVACFVLSTHWDGSLRCLRCVSQHSSWDDAPAGTDRHRFKRGRYARA